MRLKTKLETQELSKNCSVNTYITDDEQHYVFELNYMDGKFTTERTFPNNREGIEDMEEMKIIYNTELSVQRYFGII